ncbi:ABC transporter permease [Hymenobacter guriensis]|uniref:ABC transporter permease n=1 Tax=Hymenobacter guriensis TaxID=2793065 RepID=A0ABS0L870_9BACT|nr:ABC transporter permease [Hymenobacter guriensis]MBG8556279.1 ABC transporter permease [Hymenobacter guriensis]
MLALLSEALGLTAAYLGINLRGVTTVALFANNILGRLTFGEVLPSVIKTFFFGFAIGLIGCGRCSTMRLWLPACARACATWGRPPPS